jgi:hypothetical protein
MMKKTCFCATLNKGTVLKMHELIFFCKNFLFPTSSRPALGFTQPLVQWLPRVLSPGVKQPGRETYQSPPTSAEVEKNVALYIHSPIRLHCVVLNYLSTGTIYLLRNCVSIMKFIWVEHSRITDTASRSAGQESSVFYGSRSFIKTARY